MSYEGTSFDNDLARSKGHVLHPPHTPCPAIWGNAPVKKKAKKKQKSRASSAAHTALSDLEDTHTHTHTN